MGAMQQMLLTHQAVALGPVIPSTFPPQTQDILSLRTASLAGALAQAGIAFRVDGTLVTFVRDNTGNVVFSNYNWILPTTAGVGNNYWVRATSGQLFGGAVLNTWLQLNTERNWQKQINAGPNQTGENSGSIFVEISSSSTGVPVLASGNVQIRAIVTA
jgi:hypothetical protein